MPCPVIVCHSIYPHRSGMESSQCIVSEPRLLRDPNGGCMLRFDNNNYRLVEFLAKSILENTFNSFCRISLLPESVRQAITQVDLFNTVNGLRPNATETDKIP